MSMADHHDDHHTNVYEEVKLEEMTYDAEAQLYQYSCPCGDLFEIGLEDLWDGEDIALCPSCSLKLRVLYDEDSLPELNDESTDEDAEDEAEEKARDDECGSITAEDGIESHAGKGSEGTDNDAVTGKLIASLSKIQVTATIVESK